MWGEFGVIVVCSGRVQGQGAEWPQPISSEALEGGFILWLPLGRRLN